MESDAVEKLKAAILSISPRPLSMTKWDEAKIESDIEYRFQFLATFVGFTEDDIKTIHGAAPLLAPLVPTIVEAVYNKLFSYDVTKQHFLPRNIGYDGELAKNLEEFTLEHDQIKYRKKMLSNYLVKLVTQPYDKNFISYLNWVGKIHTGSAEGKPGTKHLHVPLVLMNALLTWVNDALNVIITNLGLPRDKEIAAIRAFTKLLWIQNDFMSKHYVTGSQH